MGQELNIDIKASSNVPEQVDKAKNSAASFEKQLSDINKKFSTSFKDVFLSFTAPLVIINTIIAAINERIEKARRIAKEGFDSIVAGENQFASAQEQRMAQFIAAQEKLNKEREGATAGRKEITEKYIESQGMAYFLRNPNSFLPLILGELGLPTGANFEWIQKAAAEDFEKNLTPAEKAQMAKEAADKNAPTTFKSPEGFSNVVGVGSNPVIEAMSLQLEEMKKQTEFLAAIAAESDPDTDFTKDEYQPYGM